MKLQKYQEIGTLLPDETTEILLYIDEKYAVVKLVQIIRVSICTFTSISMIRIWSYFLASYWR